MTTSIERPVRIELTMNGMLLVKIEVIYEV